MSRTAAQLERLNTKRKQLDELLRNNRVFNHLQLVSVLMLLVYMAMSIVCVGLCGVFAMQLPNMVNVGYLLAHCALHVLFIGLAVFGIYKYMRALWKFAGEYHMDLLWYALLIAAFAFQELFLVFWIVLAGITDAQRIDASAAWALVLSRVPAGISAVLAVFFFVPAILLARFKYLAMFAAFNAGRDDADKLTKLVRQRLVPQSRRRAADESASDARQPGDATEPADAAGAAAQQMPEAANTEAREAT